jgi:murein DD-endopeptidase MepM/ murein hydrolase activator NlpD
VKSTKNIYSLPLPLAVHVTKVVTDSPGHPGPYRGAIDFAVPAGTDVLAPLDGEVITVVDKHEAYGKSIKYTQYVNYVQIAHMNGEISDLMHLAKGSVVVKVGQQVKQGQLIAKTGLSGYMTAPHLHWFVFVKDKSEDGFHGLRIRQKT